MDTKVNWQSTGRRYRYHFYTDMNPKTSSPAGLTKVYVETIKFRISEFPDINGNNPLCPEVDMIVVRQPRR